MLQITRESPHAKICIDNPGQQEGPGQGGHFIQYWDSYAGLGFGVTQVAEWGQQGGPGQILGNYLANIEQILGTYWANIG